MKSKRREQHLKEWNDDAYCENHNHKWIQDCCIVCKITRWEMDYDLIFLPGTMGTDPNRKLGSRRRK